jgi:undecaprenyldiphospho-muramoylpentapeptide beta-N-acetylglucosaminyltransferase
MRVIVSAGGTGGHICPALAIIDKIIEREPDSEVLYIGTTDRMEATMVPAKGINYVGIEMKGLNRRNPFKNISVINSYRKAVKKVKKIIKDFKPDVVLGIGGYITAPVIIAAHSLGVKTFIHEQNAIPGLSNKILNRYADVIAVSLPDSLKYFNKKKVIYTGNPTSEEVLMAKPVVKSKYDLSKNKKLVLIVMGSLGSMIVNKKMRDILPAFEGKEYEVLFVTGNAYYEEYKKLKLPKNVKLVSYLDDMRNVERVVDVMVSRAGASTIAEITALGIPTVFIPSPYVTHNHQYKNALVLEKIGAASIIEEKELEISTLLKEIDDILGNEKKYNSMKKNCQKLAVTDSSTKIYEIIKKLVVGD